MAQVIPFVAMPILTRLLPPDVLGPYFIWLGVVGILSVVLSLRMDLALFNAKTHRDLQITLQTAIIISIVIAVILWLVLQLVRYIFPYFADKLNLNWWGDEAIILALVWVLNMVVQSAYIYGGYFKRQAVAKVILATTVAFSQILACVLDLGVHGLIVFQIIATLIVSVININEIRKIYNIRICQIKISNIIKELKKNWKFPVFSMPADFVNSLSGQLPTLILGNRLGGDIAGQYSLMTKAIGTPTKLISSSILSIFKEEASNYYREHAECRAIYLKALKRLAIIGITPFGILYLYSEYLFAFVFGSEWGHAGKMASLLAPAFYLQFIASPLSFTLYMSGRQLTDLYWQTAMAAVTLVVFALSKDEYEAIRLYSYAMSLMYAINICISYNAATKKKYDGK